MGSSDHRLERDWGFLERNACTPRFLLPPRVFLHAQASLLGSRRYIRKVTPSSVQTVSSYPFPYLFCGSLQPRTQVPRTARQGYSKKSTK